MNRMAVFVSGRGSNLQALLDQEGCNIRLVCSHAEAIAADYRCKRNFIPVFKTKKIDFVQWQMTLKGARIQQIFLLGFMRLIPAFFIETWDNKILNVHPSLLPLFPGLAAMEKSFAEKTDMGISIHRVTAEMDAGEILSQSMVFNATNRPNDFKTSSLMMAFREHFLVQRMGEKWN